MDETVQERELQTSQIPLAQSCHERGLLSSGVYSMHRKNDKKMQREVRGRGWGGFGLSTCYLCYKNQQ